ncbi:Serine proteases, trypsin family, serine active site,Peptidase S1, PA clan,Serine proteases, trypsin [Cinara cedri]|uniref:Serine proteases, trypsin family, serine active site,Peptidase S1, PA clan,Serine proteases, trypsin n=1 Tax=Cinara cedri TaxID=506608 RepID=A0A5E4N0Y4_9HEMI|nr:Serine proteases, trypsin family, serine active site,Peptidase S1, PA clan,Serine proteases, trypsin [Cinara cedri]
MTCHTQSWKLKIFSILIVVTYCHGLQQKIGDECINKNGDVGFCQLKNKCTKDADLGTICNSEQITICCAKYISKNKPNSNSSYSHKDDQLPQSRFGSFSSFFHTPIPSQKPITNNDFLNHQKHNFIGYARPQNTDTVVKFVENRPHQYFEQDVITELLSNNNNNNNYNNQNLNIDDFNSDQTTRKNKIRQNNYNYETQRPNQYGNNKYTYYQITEKNTPNYTTQILNQNKNLNYYTSTQKLQKNLSLGNNDNNSQFSTNQTNYSNYEENKKLNQDTNYRQPTTNKLHSASTNDDFYFTTPKQRPIDNEKRISEIKCEEYSKSLTTTISVLPLSIDDTAPKPVLKEKCNSKSIELIVGGTKAELGEFPHMVAIGFRTASGDSWNCGGTLISEQFVLTAAHCIYSTLGNPVKVRLGELNLQKNNDGASPLEVLIDEIIVHPDYVSPSKYYDIALMRLDKIVRFNNHIRPACLYNNANIPSHKVTATGWGSIQYGDQSSEDLLKVDINIIDNAKCNQLYESEKKRKTLNRGIIDSMICAGDLAGGHDTCLGDSGGPLVIRSEKNACVFNLIGITSFGKSCATENSPGVYTRVSAFIPWIEKIVWS